MLLRPIGVAAFAAGLAAALAAVAAWASGPTDFTPSLGALSSAVMKVAAVFFAAPLVSAALMPSTKTLVGEDAGEATPPLMFVVFLTGLLAIAAVAAGPLGAWWNENAELATRLKSHLSHDEPGIVVVPIVVLFAMPLLASAATATGMIASVLGTLARRTLTSRVLGSCVTLQIGLALGLALTLDALGDAGATIVPWVRGRSGPESAALASQAAEWFARQDQLGVAVVREVLWLAGGYAAALAWSLFFNTGQPASDGPAAQRSSREAVAGALERQHRTHPTER
jgi:hypothetical protein